MPQESARGLDRLAGADSDLATLRRELAPSFRVCAWLYFFALAPILIYVPHHLDDHGRAVSGSFGWQLGGRPLADLLMFIVDVGRPLALPTPLFQILAIAMLALAGALVARMFSIRSPMWAAVATLPIAAQPYYLENMSFAFDAVTMSAAVLLTVSAAALAVSEQPAVARYAGAGGLLVSALSMYQPSTSGFVPLCVIAIAARFAVGNSSTRDSLSKIGQTLLIFIAALIVYRVAVLSLCQLADNASEYSRFIPLTPGFPRRVLANVRDYWQLVFRDWSGTVLGRLALAAGAACLLLPAFTTRPPHANRSSRLLLSALALVVSAAFVHGPPLLLVYPFISQPRAVVSIGLLLSGVCCLSYVYAQSTALPRLGRATLIGASGIVLVSIAWSLVVVSYTYAATFRAQSEFEHSLVTRLAYDIEHSDAILRASKVETVAFVGVFPNSRIMLNTERKLPYLSRVMPRLVDNNKMWGQIFLSLYSLSRLDYRDWFLTEEQLQQMRDKGEAVEIFNSRAYRGFIADGTLLIWIPNPS